MRHKRSIPNRGFRIADQIQRDLAELIRELKDPRIGMVTLHAVEVSADYAHAKVFFSLLVGDPKECEEALNEAAGFLRNGLFKRLQIHTVPTLHFHFDRTTERGRRSTSHFTHSLHSLHLTSILRARVAASLGRRISS